MVNERVDWTDERHRRILEEQRKFMWTPEQLERLAAWIGLEPGWTMLDLGCGLGYVGRTYAPFLSPGGRVVGVDREAALLEEARRRAAESDSECSFEYVWGEACSVPLGEASVEVAFCQTLLMHLPDPESCLAEMVRLVKPGGVVVCNEPNNAPVYRSYHSAYQPSLEEEIEDAVVGWTAYEGAKARGRGDASVGGRVPEMMHKLGLVDIDARLNEKVYLLVPPYETPFQQHFKNMMRGNIESREAWREEGRESFLAGGGDPALWERSWDRWTKVVAELKTGLENEDLYVTGSSLFYSIRGRKPRS